MVREIEVALKNLKNQSHQMEVKPKLDRSAHFPDSNSPNDTQILFYMLKIYPIKVLVKLVQVAVTKEATIW